MSGEEQPHGLAAAPEPSALDVSVERRASASDGGSVTAGYVRPATEPSTPLRSTLVHRDIPTYSQPVRSSTQFTPLPRTQLGVLAHQLESQRTAASPRKRSHPLTPRALTPTRNSLTPRLASSRLNTPRSRESPGSQHRAAKRRRSSIVIEADGQTVFNPAYTGPVTLDYLRLLCKVVIEEQKKAPEKQAETVEVDIREYNEKGLPYPTNTEELLRAPFISSSGSPQTQNPFYEAPKQDPKTFSYLERILAAQGKAQKMEPTEVQSETFPEVNDTNYGELKTPNQFFDNDNLNDNLDEIDTHNDQAGLVTPGSTSPGFDNQGIVQNDIISDNEMLESSAPQPFEHQDRPLTNIDGSPVPRVEKRREKARKPNDNLSLRMVKNIVKSVAVQNSESTKAIKMSPEVMDFIHSQSDIFLANIMSDLEAYALHRTNGRGSTINMNDALLLINNLRLINEDGTRAKALISYLELARNYLPLEQVMALYNNLRSGNMPSQNKSDDDDDNVQDRTLRVSGFSDSDADL